MFTGIIQELGTVWRVERSRGLSRLTVAAPAVAARVRILESVAVNGVCLTVVDVRRPAMTFELIGHTQRLTTLGALRRGERVHVEPSLSLSDRLSGHLVFGHVDGLGAVVKRRQHAGELVLELRVPEALRRLVVPKGPVAVDGVSLTVGDTPTRLTFTVHLIPETLRQTALRGRKVHDRVNVEVDYFAKLVAQLIQP